MPSSFPTPVLPSRIEDLPYRDLTGRVRCDDWRMHGVAHIGGFADIYIGYLTEDDDITTKVAIKVLRMANEEGLTAKIRKSIIRETATWHTLRHQNVLEFLGLAADFGRYGCPALISPYCDKGTAKDYLALHPDLDTRLYVIKGVAEGLRYLHHNKVVHGDLKPSNVLIHSDGHPLLCDFGRSKILNSGGFTATGPSGVSRYQAPELLSGEGGPNKASDIYAFATTSYELWTGLEPFHTIHHNSSIIISIVMRDARPDYPNHAPLGTDLLWKVLQDSWKTEPEERLDVDQVVEKLTNLSDKLR